MSRSTIYFIQAGETGPIKIGVTCGNPLARMANLQTGCPTELRLVGHAPGTAQDERQLHERFAHLRIRGEWFVAKHELVEFIRGVCFATREAPPLRQPSGPMIGSLCTDDLDKIAAYVVLHGVELRALAALEVASFDSSSSAVTRLRAVFDELLMLSSTIDGDMAMSGALNCFGRNRLDGMRACVREAILQMAEEREDAQMYDDETATGNAPTEVH